MPEEARLVANDGGLEPQGEGWFVVNAADAPWWHVDGFGASCGFEGEARFREYGVNIHVLQPGEPNAMYHGEAAQEDFLVVAGECLLLIEGEERRLAAWDFVHCPAWTEHVFVGAGEGPCVIVMIGSRADDAIRYPVSELASRHGAGVERETREPREAYAHVPHGRVGPSPRAGVPWGHWPQ
jgi:uncharacterized cupin superfamily protein